MKKGILLKIFLFCFLVFCLIGSNFISNVSAGPIWPSSWTLIDNDSSTDCNQPQRNVLNAYYALGASYLYLRMKTEGSPNVSNTLYKWFLDSSNDAYSTGTSIVNYENLVIAYQNKVYLCGPSIDKLTNCAQITNTNELNYRIDGNNIDMAISLNDYGPVKSVWWITDSSVNNLNQQPNGNKVDWPDSGAGNIPFIPITECTPGNTGSCLTGQSGICSAGTRTCGQNGFWGPCVQINQPITEICNNLDDDCDGNVDENLTRPTTCGLGVCSQNTGIETCTAGQWGGNTCNPFGGAGEEICDGLDNDCNGNVDEGCECINGQTRQCGDTDVGECSYGVQTCVNGIWGECVGAIYSTTEICNNLDDDCDGNVDENLTRPTTCGLGVCSQNTGIETCTAGQWGGNTCNPFGGAGEEICENDLDDDCDGDVDGEDSDCVESPYCGDGERSEGEECDNGSQNGVVCAPACNSSCQYCSNECAIVTVQGSACGVGGGSGTFYHALSINKTGSGFGSVISNIAGINCGSMCSKSYPKGSQIILTATPDGASSFGGWSGACSGTNNTCTVDMDNDKLAIASFEAGEVLGEAVSQEEQKENVKCALYLLEYIKYGAKNNPEEVKKLQTFLNEHMAANLPISGIYDSQTREWVNKFQLKHKEQVLRPWVEAGLHSSENIPTGYVYITTRRWINLIKCPSLVIPISGLTCAGCQSGFKPEGEVLGESVTPEEGAVSGENENIPPEEEQFDDGEFSGNLEAEEMKTGEEEPIQRNRIIAMVILVAIIIAGGATVILMKKRKS